MEMGFDEKEVMDALKVSNNQQNAAVSPRPRPLRPALSSTPTLRCLRATRGVTVGQMVQVAQDLNVAKLWVLPF